MRIAPAKYMAGCYLVHVDSNELAVASGKPLPYPTCIGSFSARKICVWSPAGYKPRGYRAAALAMLEQAQRETFGAK